jgi:hypothetical protein
VSASASDGDQVSRGEPIGKLASVELDPFTLTTRLDAAVCGLAEDPMLMELAASLKGAQTVLRPPLVSQLEDEVPVVATGVCTQCQQLLRAASVSPQFEQSRATPKRLVFDDPSGVVAPTVGEEDPAVAATMLRLSAGAS